jgi:HK97 family phage portal protein
MSLRTRIARWLVGDLLEQRKGYSLKNEALKGMFPTVFGDSTQFTAPFKQHPGLYAAIMVKARTLAGTPFELYRIGGDEPTKDVYYESLLKRPNDHMSGFQMWQAIVIQLDLFGEAIAHMPMQGTRPAGFVFLHPPNITEVVDDGQLVAWQHGKRRYPAEEIIQWKYWNPYDQIRGLAPYEALKLGLGADYNAIRFNKLFFDNSSEPGTVYTTDESLSEPDYQRTKSAIIDSRRGVTHAHEAMLLDNGLKPTNIRKSNKDMQFLEQRKYTVQEVAMVYGVPKEALQIYEDINYATAITADLSLWKKTIMPLAKLIQDKLDGKVLNPAGLEGKFDFKSNEALNYELAQKVEAAKSLYEMGVPFNTIDDRLNLGIGEVPGGDEPKPSGIPAPQQGPKSLTSEAKLNIPVEYEEPETIPVDEKLVRATRWKNLIDRVGDLDTRAARAMREYFYEIRKKILRLLEDGKGMKRLNEEDADVIAAYFNDEKLAGALEPYLEEAVYEGVGTLEADLTGAPDASIQQTLFHRTKKLAGINETAREVVLSKLNDALSEILEQGLTEKEAAELLKKKLKGAMEVNLNRARTIARTEVHGAYSEGRHIAADATHPKYKQWITSRDARVRDWHAYLDGEKVPYEEPYSNGMMYPHDPNGGAAEVINCRCVEVYYYEDDNAAT